MPLIETGTYRAMVINNCLKKSKLKGTPSVNLQWEIKFATNAPNIPIRGTVYSDHYLSEKTIERTFQLMREVFGWEKEVSEFNDPNRFYGYMADLVIDHEEFEGKVRAKVSFVNPCGGKRKPMEDAEANSIAKSLANTAKAFHAKNKGKIVSKAVKSDAVPLPVLETPNETPADTPVPEDDLPF